MSENQDNNQERIKIKLVHEEVAEKFNIDLDNIEYRDGMKILSQEMQVKVILDAIENIEKTYDFINKDLKNKNIIIQFPTSEVKEKEKTENLNNQVIEHDKRGVITEVQKQKLPLEFEEAFNRQIFKSIANIIKDADEDPKDYNRTMAFTTTVSGNSLQIQF